MQATRDLLRHTINYLYANLKVVDRGRDDDWRLVRLRTHTECPERAVST